MHLLISISRSQRTRLFRALPSMANSPARPHRTFSTRPQIQLVPRSLPSSTKRTSARTFQAWRSTRSQFIFTLTSRLTMFTPLDSPSSHARTTIPTLLTILTLSFCRIKILPPQLASRCLLPSTLRSSRTPPI